MEINFAFVPNQKVETPFGDLAMVDMCAVQGGGVKRCYVLLKDGRGAWFDEDQLKAI